MIAFEPYSIGGLSVAQDSAPYDALTISFAPSVDVDSTAAAQEFMDMSSVRSFMQDQWRAASENMIGLGSVMNYYS